MSVAGGTLLLRTEESRFLGCRHFARFYFWSGGWLRSSITHVQFFGRKKGIVKQYIYNLGTALLLTGSPFTLLACAIMVKTYATFWCAVRHPITTVFSIPENWKRAVLSLDVFILPELVPGLRGFISSVTINKDGKIVPNDDDDRRPMGPLLVFDYGELFVLHKGRSRITRRHAFVGSLILAFFITLTILLWGRWYAFGPLLFVIVIGPEVLHSMIQTLLYPPFVGIFFLPAFAYRLMLKAIAITYFPLFVTIQRSTATFPVQLQLEELRDGKWAGFTRKLAWIFGGIIAAKILLFSLEIKMIDDWTSSPLRQFLSLLVVPQSIPLWQYATLISAALVIGFYFFTDFILRKYRRGDLVDEKGVLITMRVVVIVTGLLGFYSTVANIWIVAHHKQFLQFPVVGKWWP